MASSVAHAALDMVLEHLFVKAPVDDQPLLAPSRPVVRNRIEPLGTTLRIAGVYYHVPGAPIAVTTTLATSAGWLDGELSPVTVLAVDAVEDVAKTIGRYALDDVWSQAFLDSARRHPACH